MAVSSQMLPLGTPLPDFSLPDVVSGRSVSTSELAGKPVVIAFICNHCPYVKHIRASLAEFGRYCQMNGASILAISSNDITTHPQDGPDAMADEAKQVGYSFPYLYDESQAVAKAFRAACTPEFYVFDAAGKLVYRGQFDESRPGSNKPVTGVDVRAALDATLSGESPPAHQKPSIGCNIKWKSGNEPEYA